MLLCLSCRLRQRLSLLGWVVGGRIGGALLDFAGQGLAYFLHSICAFEGGPSLLFRPEVLILRHLVVVIRTTVHEVGLERELGPGQGEIRRLAGGLVDEVDQVGFADAQQVPILALLEQEDEAALHRRLVKVEPRLLEDLAELLKCHLVFLLAVARDAVEELGFHLCFLELLSDDKLHLLLFVRAEVDYLALHLLDDEEHDFHRLGRPRLVNEDASACGIGISLVVGDGLPVLLVEEAREV